MKNIFAKQSVLRGALLSASILMLTACDQDLEQPEEELDLAEEMGALPDMSEDASRLDLDRQDEGSDLGGDDEEMSDEVTADMRLDQAQDMVDQDMTLEPLRQVVSRGILGGLPAENYVKDPLFSTLNQEYNWLTLRYDQSGFVPTYRHVALGSPLEVASMKVPKSSGTRALIYGEVLYHANTTFRVSLWLGQGGFTIGASELGPQIQAIGFNPEQPTEYGGVVLEPVQDEAFVAEGRQWQKYEALVSGFAGYGHIVVVAELGADLYLHAPLLEVLPAPPSGKRDLRANRLKRVSKETEEGARFVSDYAARKRAVPRQNEWRSTSPTPYPF